MTATEIADGAERRSGDEHKRDRGGRDDNPGMQQGASPFRSDASGSYSQAGATGNTGKRPRDDGAEQQAIKRRALSCGECQRRKLKCDRKIPCAACLKRRAPEQCTWEEVKIKPEPQPFALADDVVGLSARLARVEEALKSARLLPSQPAMDRPSAGEVALEETEDAVARLEGKAFGRTNASYLYLSTQPTTHPEPSSMAERSLTKALTCIEDARPVGAYTDAPMAGRDEERNAQLDLLLSLCPPKEISLALVQKYFEDFDWLHSVVHRPSFEAEHAYFIDMMESYQQFNVDPVWLALLYMVLAMALEGVRSHAAGTNFPQYDAYNPRDFYDAAQKLLHVGDYMGVPQARSIICVLLFGQWIQSSSVGGQVDRFLLWLSSATRIAQLMGLHLLGDSSDTMPRDDPCWPPGANSVKREGALRIWAALLFADWLSAGPAFRVYLLHPSQFNTSAPSNADDSGLSPTSPAITVVPHTNMTSASYTCFKHRLAVMCRKNFDAAFSAGNPMSYTRLLELNAGFASIIEDLPDAWKETQGLVHAAGETQLASQNRWRYHLAVDGVHSRLVKLNRRFLLRGLSGDDAFRASSDQCLTSAKAVLQAQQSILDVSANYWFIYSSTLSAVLVLFCCLFHLIDAQVPAHHLTELESTIDIAVRVFDRGDLIRSPLLQQIASKAHRTTRELGNAVIRRKEFAERVGVEVSPTPNKSFAQTLVEVARSLDVEEPSESGLFDFDNDYNFTRTSTELGWSGVTETEDLNLATTELLRALGVSEYHASDWSFDHLYQM